MSIRSILQATIRAARSIVFIGACLLPLFVVGTTANAQSSTLKQLLQRLLALIEAEEYEEAKPIARRTIEKVLSELGPGGRPEAGARSHLGDILVATGDLVAAKREFQRSKQIYEDLRKRAKGNGLRVITRDLISILLKMSGIEVLRYEPDAALALAREADSLYTRTTTDAAQKVEILNALGGALKSRRDHAQASNAFMQALSLSNNIISMKDKATLLSNLGGVHYELAQFDAAYDFYRRAQFIFDLHLPDHSLTALNLSSYGAVLIELKRVDDARRALDRAIPLLDATLGENHPHTAIALLHRAILLLKSKQRELALVDIRRAYDIRARQYGRNHISTAAVLATLGGIYLEGHDPNGDRYFKQALDIYLSSLDASDHRVFDTYLSLGISDVLREDWTGAVRYLFEASRSALLSGQKDGFGHATGVVSEGLRPRSPSLLFDAQKRAFMMLVKALYRTERKNSEEETATADEAFTYAQWHMISSTSVALDQQVKRSESSNPIWAKQVRKRQDLVADWQRLNASMMLSLSNASGNDLARVVADFRDRMRSVQSGITDIDALLVREFPSLSTFVFPEPITIEKAQSLLWGSTGPQEEALVVFFDTSEWAFVPEETYVWVITKAQTKWYRVPLGGETLNTEVQALRCGLDLASWHRDGGRTCRSFGLPEPKRDARGQIRIESLPFDTLRAYRLFNALLGSAREMISGKRLIVVPSGSLTLLPIHVLITRDPSGQTLQSAPWLVQDHAIFVLPSVASLAALRPGNRSVANRRFVGVGNPLLNGPDQRFAERARTARGRDRCLEPTGQVIQIDRSGGVTPRRSRGGLVDSASLLQLPPLPETADEICAVGRALGAEPDDIYLGVRAREGRLKVLSEDGRLKDYQVVHFATHGTLAGQISNTAEPGLILTPPARSTEADDGYLSASEVAALKLDAEWVILSACNTAASGVVGGDALSGLARAFFYAQARALLVSHWEVDTEAAKVLIVGTISRFSADEKSSRAGALQSAMLTLINNADPDDPVAAHPAMWAPFMVVGEGAR